MANVDYVTIRGASLADALAALKAAADVTKVVERPRSTTLLNSDERVELSASPRSWEPDTIVVEVYLGGSEEEQLALSRRVYDYLVENTDWDVELDSDNAEDTIASRIRATT